MKANSGRSGITVDPYRPDDRSAVDAMFRRVFGDVQADASADRWPWQYLRNPHAPEPRIWIARDGDAIVGQYATMPVRLAVAGHEISGSWGMDVMVAPERQRQGIGEILFRAWDGHTGAALGMGLSPGSHRLFRKLQWPDVGPVPCLVKPLSATAFNRPDWPDALNRLVAIGAAPLAFAVRAKGRVDSAVQRVDQFDRRFTDLWERVASKFDLAVRRDAEYLQWKYAAHPRLSYSCAALERGNRLAGYVVFRHLDHAGGRLTALVDFLADPDDPQALVPLFGFMEEDARRAGSVKVRAFVMHAAFRKTMQAHGYFRVASTIQLVAKINALPVAPDFYSDTSGWHVTFGDSDQDR